MSAEPCCPKCAAAEITSLTTSFQGVTGVLVFCGECGAAITWAPKPEK